MEKSLEFLANVKRVETKTLVSGDKEVKLDLRIVGADVLKANRLADLPVDRQVKITAEFQ